MNQPQADTIELKTLMEYVQGFKLFIISIGRFLLRMLKTRFLLLIAPVVIACGFGLYKYFRAGSSYTVEMQLAYNELYKKTYGEMIFRLQTQLRKGDLKTVSRELQLPEEQVKQVADIYALNIAKSPLHEDVSTEHLPFYVVAVLKDRTIADTLQAHIIDYLRNNPLNQERRRINMVNMQERLVFLENQLALMDSIKTNYNNQLKRGAHADPLTNQVAIEKLFSLSDSLFDEKLKVRSGIESYKSVELIYGFMPSEQPDKPALGKMLLKYTGIGLACSILILFWLAIPTREQE